MNDRSSTANTKKFTTTDESSSKSWIYFVFGLIISLFGIVLLRRLGQVGLYSDTAFVPAQKSYSNKDSAHILQHLDQNCVFARKSTSSAHSYIRSCEIREGAYMQECFGDGRDTANCAKPAIIKNAKLEECQKAFINERFFKKEQATNAVSNCAKNKRPPLRAADYDWEHEHIDDEGSHFSYRNAADFKLTR